MSDKSEVLISKNSRHSPSCFGSHVYIASNVICNLNFLGGYSGYLQNKCALLANTDTDYRNSPFLSLAYLGQRTISLYCNDLVISPLRYAELLGDGHLFHFWQVQNLSLVARCPAGEAVKQMIPSSVSGWAVISWGQYLWTVHKCF